MTNPGFAPLSDFVIRISFVIRASSFVIPISSQSRLWSGSWLAVAESLEPKAEAIEVEIDDRRGVEGEHLAHDEAAHDGDAERTAEFGAGAGADDERQSAKRRGHGGHEDGAETEQARFED